MWQPEEEADEQLRLLLGSRFRVAELRPTHQAEVVAAPLELGGAKVAVAEELRDRRDVLAHQLGL